MTSYAPPSTGQIDHPYDPREEAAFTEFRPTQVDLSREVTALGRAIRDRIIHNFEAMSGGGGFPRLLIGESFGAGSFGRGTHSAPLRDIDIYLVMNAGGLPLYDFLTGHRISLEGATAGPLTDDPHLSVGGWLSAAAVAGRVVHNLQRLDLVTQYGLAHGLNRSGKAAFLRFADGVNVDITPVVWARFSQGIDRFYMPEGNGSLWWKPTNPKEDQRRLTDLNKASGDLALPTIRALKWWNTNRNHDRLKGIHVEVLAEQALLGWTFHGVAQGLHICFEALPALLRYRCADPTDLGPELDVNLDPADREDTCIEAYRARDCARQAARLASLGLSDLAIGAWRAILPLR